MDRQIILERLTAINKQFLELLLKINGQITKPTEQFMSEIMQLQVSLDQLVKQIKNNKGAHELHLAKRFYELQEKERKTISDTLYNQFGQTLFSFMLGLELLEKYNMDQMHKDHLRDMREQAYNASVQIRNLANNLHPLTISDLGLFAAIRSLLNSLQEQNMVKIEFGIIEDNLEISSINSLFIYRILESTMNYILQFENVNQINIHIDIENENLGMRFLITYIEAIEFVGSNKNLDYYEIFQRVKVIGGNITIENLHATTQIQIVVPEIGDI